MCVFTVHPTYAQAPKGTQGVPTVRELVQKYSLQYGSSPTQLEKVMQCESSGNPNAWNKKDPGDGSKGIMQFQKNTFYDHAQKLGISDPDIWNVDQQIQIAAYMFSLGEQYQWTCSRLTGVIK